MHIFIDESGSFAGYHPQSTSVVGALAIPNSALAQLIKRYAKIRAALPKDQGEVKGRLLNEAQIDKVVTLLARNEAIFEVTALDLGLHTEESVRAYKQKHGEEMLAKVPDFAASVRPDVEKASRYILETSAPLYLQALTTFEVLHRLLGFATTFFAQRKPYELGSFTWVVDGKDRNKTTRWEEWWPEYAQGAMATMSKSRPSPRLPAQMLADYSFYDRFSMVGDHEGTGTNLKLLLGDIRFSNEAEPGLEFVDIVTNAVRRALTGNLQREGWQNIHKLMIHRNRDTYVQFVVFEIGGRDVVRGAPYGPTVHAGFSRGGRSMLTRKNSRIAAEETAIRNPVL